MSDETTEQRPPHPALEGNHSKVIRPAEVKITVLKPISTKGWNRRSVVKNCREVRKTYLAILGQTDDPGR